MPDDKSEILQGTLDLMVLQTLDAMGPQHGYGIARRIEQVAEGMLELNQGTIYPALLQPEAAVQLAGTLTDLAGQVERKSP